MQRERLMLAAAACRSVPTLVPASEAGAWACCAPVIMSARAQSRAQHAPWADLLPEVTQRIARVLGEEDR